MGKSSGKPSGELHGQAVVQSFVEGESDQNQFYFNFEETQISHFQIMFFASLNTSPVSQQKIVSIKINFCFLQNTNISFCIFVLQIIFCNFSVICKFFGAPEKGKTVQKFISPQNVDCVDAFGGQETLVEFSAGRKLQKICFCLNQHWSKDLFYERYNKFCSTKYTLFY